MLQGLVLLAILSQTPATPREVPFRTIAFGVNRQIKDGGAIIIRDAASLDRYRKKMGTQDSKKPTVDWPMEEIVAIHAAGTLYGSDSIQVVKVSRLPDGNLQVDAALNRGSVPATPTPGVVPVLHKEGLYVLIVIPSNKGGITLRVVDPPASSGDRTGTPGIR